MSFMKRLPFRGRLAGSNVNAHCCAATEQLLAFPELPCGTNVFVLPEIFEVALGAATRSTKR